MNELLQAVNAAPVNCEPRSVLKISGSRFVARASSNVSTQNAASIVIDVSVERLWRSVKYEEVYLHAYDSVSALRAGISRYRDLYNRRRPHSTLDGRTPDAAYYRLDSMPPIRLAA